MNKHNEMVMRYMIFVLIFAFVCFNSKAQELKPDSIVSELDSICWGFNYKPNSNRLTLCVLSFSFGKSFFNVGKYDKKTYNKLFKNHKGLHPSEFALYFNMNDCTMQLPIRDDAVCEVITVDTTSNTNEIRRYNVRDFVIIHRGNPPLELTIECDILEYKYPIEVYNWEPITHAHITYVRRITRYIYR